jgi:hypothetical protein
MTFLRWRPLFRAQVLLPGRPLEPNHGVQAVERGRPAQVGEGGLEAGQAVGEEARVGGGVGVEPADAAEDVEAGAHGVSAAAYGAWSAVADADKSPCLS